MVSAKRFVANLLAQAGVTINGDQPYDVQVHDERVYRRVLAGGSLAAGESYMDGWWDVADLAEFFSRVLGAELNKKLRYTPATVWNFLKASVLNLQSLKRAFMIGEQHYDKGNDLYQAMLDERMVYTCAYWKDADTLDDAQEDKLDLVCRKLGLQEGDRVLDIGCGWGSFLEYAAQEYGIEGVGVTVSEEQVELGRERVQELPVEIRLQDYREVDEQFDHIVSLGMFEHVGYKNYDTYMRVVDRCLADDGLFLLHTIGTDESTYTTDAWIAKYIFPNSMIPSVKQIAQAAEGHFVMEDWHTFGPYYDLTLQAWDENFRAAWDDLKQEYDERFYRMWRYYLNSAAGSFRCRKNNLFQVVFSKQGVPGGYESVR